MLALFYGVAVILIGASGFRRRPACFSRSGLSPSPQHLVWQIARLDIGDPDNCLAVSNPTATLD